MPLSMFRETKNPLWFLTSTLYNIHTRFVNQAIMGCRTIASFSLLYIQPNSVWHEMQQRKSDHILHSEHRNSLERCHVLPTYRNLHSIIPSKCKLAVFEEKGRTMFSRPSGRLVYHQ